MCQLVIFGNLTLIWNFDFHFGIFFCQKFESTLSFLSFSRQLKIRNNLDRKNRRTIAGKLRKNQTRVKLLFGISQKVVNSSSRAVLFPRENNENLDGSAIAGRNKFLIGKADK